MFPVADFSAAAFSAISGLALPKLRNQSFTFVQYIRMVNMLARMPAAASWRM